jgi:hypothetical protein
MKTINNLPFSTVFAIACFTIGTLLFASYMLFKSDDLLILGFFYVIGALFFNTIILFHLIYELITSKEKYEILLQIVILLSNIPIAILYLTIIF